MTARFLVASAQLSGVCLQVTRTAHVCMLETLPEPALPRLTHRCGTCPLTGTSGSGSTGTCCGFSFESCSGAHTCRIPALGEWSSEKSPAGNGDIQWFHLGVKASQ